MEEAMDTTTPFLTIDPVVSNRLIDVFNALDGGNWKSLIDNNDDLLIRLLSQGVTDPKDRKSMQWDDANLFFISCIEITKGGRPSPLETGISKEKFGRFPYGGGSSIAYLRDWMRDSRRDSELLEEMTDLLDKLATRMSGTSMEKGVGRMEMLGWLTNSETTSLRKAMTSRCWTPSADEPLDGGCQDAAKHLLAHLRAAEKRDCGVLLRIHN